MAYDMNYRKMNFTLQKGVDIPAIGFDRRCMKNYAILYDTIDEALACGYRLFDTAGIYGNEYNVFINAFRQLLPKYGLRCYDVFMTMRLTTITDDYEFILNTFERSGLYMLDYPEMFFTDPMNPKNEEMLAATWLAISKFNDQPKIKAITVSNFNIRHLIQLTEVMAIGPLFNEVEWHPYYYKRVMVQYCVENSIRIQTCSSLGGLSRRDNALLQDPVVKEVAKKYESSPTQILLQWSVQKEIAVIPKWNDPNYIIYENMQLNFRIAKKDMKLLDKLGAKNLKFAWDPAIVA